ncbi:MAG: hypothetical protein D6730_02615 [Bacteroidetes bacterium]|nr:MAG: hypothetical protein D6730_02615 [Bacteroidota bacterium]
MFIQYFMTCTTGKLGVASFQGKGRGIVVEILGVPTFGDMTARTVGYPVNGEGIAMYVFVARYTGGFKGVELLVDELIVGRYFKVTISAT